MHVLRQERHATLAGTVAGLVPFGRNDPVPAEVLKVDRQRIPAAPRLLRVLVAVQSHQVALGPRPPAVFHEHLQVRDLRKTHDGLLRAPLHLSSTTFRFVSIARGFGTALTCLQTCYDVIVRRTRRLWAYTDTQWRLSCIPKVYPSISL